MTQDLIVGEVVLRLSPARPDKPEARLVWDLLPDGPIIRAMRSGWNGDLWVERNGTDRTCSVVFSNWK